jgi:hypothetical protein
MTKNIPVLYFEGGMLHGIRLVDQSGDLHRQDVRSWLLKELVDEKLEEESSLADEVLRQSSEEAPLATGSDESPLVSALKDAASFFKTREFAISIPLSHTLVRVFRVLVEERENLEEFLNVEFEKASPFPDEVLLVGNEIILESDKELVVLAAAYPMKSAIELGCAFEEAKVNVTHTDISVLGRLRSVWSELISDTTRPRKVVLCNFGDGWDMSVIDESSPVFFRFLGSFSSEKELVREVMFSLIGIDGGIGAKTADEIILLSNGEAGEAVKEALSSLASVRVVKCEDEYAGAEGCAQRFLEGDSIDITPATWRFSLTESRFISRAKKIMITVGAIWALAFGVLIGVPMVFDYLASQEKALSKAHEKKFKSVSDMKSRVELVKQYSDHSKGMLEVLKIISDNLPEGITLTRFTFKRGESVKISGEAAVENDVYDYKDALTRTEMFPKIDLLGPTAVRDRSDRTKMVQKFDITASFEAEEE